MFTPLFFTMDGLAPCEPWPRIGSAQLSMARLQVSAEQLRPMRRAHDLPILIGEPFVITASRGGHNSQSQWDANIRAQLGNDRPGAVQVPGSTGKGGSPLEHSYSWEGTTNNG